VHPLAATNEKPFQYSAIGAAEDGERIGNPIRAADEIESMLFRLADGRPPKSEGRARSHAPPFARVSFFAFSLPGRHLSSVNSRRTFLNVSAGALRSSSIALPITSLRKDEKVADFHFKRFRQLDESVH
jgi:hypothetical protein